MNYIVFDLEWNAPDDAAAVHPQAPERGEIVEIGAVRLDASFRTESEFKILIKPKFYQKMHRRLASMTGVYDRQLQEQGVPFPLALERFLDWCGDEFLFFTWSQSDVPALAENMRAFGMDDSILPDVVDVQRIFDREIMRTTQRTALNHAMEILGETGGRAHDALHDAQNTVKICGHLDLEQYLSEYITHYYWAGKAVIQADAVENLLADTTVNSVMCPWCGKALELEDWICGRYTRRMTRALCREGDEFLLKLSWKQQPGQFAVERSLYDMSEDLWDQYCDAKETE